MIIALAIISYILLFICLFGICLYFIADYQYGDPDKSALVIVFCMLTAAAVCRLFMVSIHYMESLQ